MKKYLMSLSLRQRFSQHCGFDDVHPKRESYGKKWTKWNDLPKQIYTNQIEEIFLWMLKNLIFNFLP